MIDILTHRRSARHMLAAFQRKQEEQAGRARAVVREHFNDGARVLMRDSKPRTAFSSLRMGDKSRGFGRREIRMGPNEVHAFITRADGSVEDLGVSLNLLTNIGRDVLHGAIGGFIPAGGAGSPATAVTSTGLTATGTPWTASNLATPQLGLAGFRVYASVTGVGTSPVYANIIANTTSVLLLDQWWTATDGLGTTPANTNGFIIGAGGIASVRFMAITTDSAAAAADDNTLASEITTNGGGRALATYAHTLDTATQTLQKAYSITGTLTAIHKMGLFCCLTSAGADPMVFETTLSADATCVSGDTLTITDTLTLSG